MNFQGDPQEALGKASVEVFYPAGPIILEEVKLAPANKWTAGQARYMDYLSHSVTKSQYDKIEQTITSAGGYKNYLKMMACKLQYNK